MVTINLLGQLQTADGDRTLACDIQEPIPIKQLIQRQGKVLREVYQLLKERKVMITVNKRVASEDTRVHDGDMVNLVTHDGMGGNGLGPSLI